MDQVHFKLAFSYCYEKAMYKFFSRLDNLISGLLLFSAMGVVAQTGSAAAGILIGALTAFQFTCRPAARAEQAKKQYLIYQKLFGRRFELSPEEIKYRLEELDAADSDTVDMLSHPSRLAALALLGLSDNSILQPPERPMYWYEKAAARFAGEWPEFRF